eukprot:scaffold718_cov342-Pavlova_lutheri.AAC.36
MNTRSAPESAPRILDSDSSADSSPSMGFPPVPNPLVTSSPICMRFFSGTKDFSSACMSVLMA